MGTQWGYSESRSNRIKQHGPAVAAALVLASLLLIAGCVPPAVPPIVPKTPTSTPPATSTPTPTPPAVGTRPIPPTSTAPLPSATAVDAVRAWYRAWFAGDILAAKRTSTTAFAKTVDEETFEGGDVTDYKILGSEGAAGTIAFYVSETREDVKGHTLMTVFVTASGSGKGYLVKGYEATPPGTQPAETVPDSATAVTKAEAQTAVTDALTALQSGDIAAAQALATDRFAAANPTWFVSANGALAEFSIVRTVRRHDVWVVQVSEMWQGAVDPDFVNFLVSDVNGEARVDRVQGWY